MLQRQIDAGEINLTGIINTHQYGRVPFRLLPETMGPPPPPPPPPGELEGADGDARPADRKRQATGITPAATMRWYDAAEPPWPEMAPAPAPASADKRHVAAQTLWRSARHRWRRLPGSEPDAATRGRVSRRTRYHGDGSAHAVSHAGQHLLSLSRRRRSSCFHGGYPVRRRYGPVALPSRLFEEAVRQPHGLSSLTGGDGGGGGDDDQAVAGSSRARPRRCTGR